MSPVGSGAIRREQILRMDWGYDIADRCGSWKANRWYGRGPRYYGGRCYHLDWRKDRGEGGGCDGYRGIRAYLK